MPNHVVFLWLLMYNSLRKENYLKTLKRLVEKLNYLTVTCPNIAYSVSVLSQYMSSPKVGHWVAVEHILMLFERSYWTWNIV